jgi:uncharacterized membrane protein YccC
MSEPVVSIANHPRASAAIRRTRARVALGAFVVVMLVALHAGVPGPDAVLRALLAGVGGFLAAWAAGVVLWKHIVIAELRRAHERRERRRRELLERAAAARREAAGA